MNCENVSNLVHAYLDNELDLPNILAIEAHLESCPNCRAGIAELSALQGAIRKGAAYHAAPESLRPRLQHLDYQPAPKPVKAGGFKVWLASWQLSKLAAAYAVLMLGIGLGWQLRQPPTLEPLPSAVVASHIRSLMVDHLTDVASSDQHTVKPWFNGKLDFSPQVSDLAPQGFPLLGGRLDYLDKLTVTALVYRRRQHIINVFIWPKADDAATPLGEFSSTLNGYNLLAFKAHGMNYWLVSDLNAKELLELKSLLVGA